MRDGCAGLMHNQVNGVVVCMFAAIEGAEGASLVGVGGCLGNVG